MLLCLNGTETSSNQFSKADNKIYEHYCPNVYIVFSALLLCTHHTSLKTFPENWDSKAPSVETLLAYFRDDGLNYIFFRNKTFCFSTFSICLKINFVKPHKISTHLAHSDNLYFHILYQLSD